MSPVKSVRRTASGDPALRFRGAQRVLAARLRRRDVLADLVREVFATADPATIGAVLVKRTRRWMPMPTVGVFTADGAGQVALLACNGPQRDKAASSLQAVATWVVERRRPLLSASLRRDRRLDAGADGTAAAFPIKFKDLLVGAIVAFDPKPSARVPALPPPLGEQVKEALGLFALALGQASRIQKAETLSVTDDLTGLYNARYLNEALHRESKRALRYKRPLSVLFIDLDAFKSVNDRFGHWNGSRTLVEAASIIRSCGRDSDFAARYGGDEFVMVLPETGSDGAAVVAQRVLTRTRDHVFLASEGLDVHLTASVGIATLPDLVPDEKTLLTAADAAMYSAKTAGKDDFRFASRG
ncbi:MAG: GGDEF domain-containing protein [Acidobacteriota bacterium]